MLDVPVESNESSDEMRQGFSSFKNRMSLNKDVDCHLGDEKGSYDREANGYKEGKEFFGGVLHCTLTMSMSSLLELIKPYNSSNALYVYECLIKILFEHNVCFYL